MAIRINEQVKPIEPYRVNVTIHVLLLNQSQNYD